MTQPTNAKFYTGAYSTLNSGQKVAIWYDRTTDTLWTPVQNTRFKSFLAINQEETCYVRHLENNRLLAKESQQAENKHKQERAAFEKNLPLFKIELKELLSKYNATLTASCSVYEDSTTTYDEEFCVMLNNTEALLTTGLTLTPSML